jgi:hypothetical protein
VSDLGCDRAKLVGRIAALDWPAPVSAWLGVARPTFGTPLSPAGTTEAAAAGSVAALDCAPAVDRAAERVVWILAWCGTRW